MENGEYALITLTSMTLAKRTPSLCLELMRLYDMYCYNVMLFGLKNAGATYHRKMARVFEPLLGRL